MTFNLEFTDLKEKINSLTKKYDDLEKEVKQQRVYKFQCIKCKEKFGNTKDLEKHKERLLECQANFECDQCELSYNSEMQLRRHVKKHGQFLCEECDREYNFEGVLEKHINVVHKSMKIFCHYHNNKKECPYGAQCIYAHDDAKECMFGNDCERILCMFKHEKHVPDDEESEDEESDDDENDEVTEEDESTIYIKDLEPSLIKVEEAMEKVSELLKKKSNVLTCNECDFEAKNTNGLNMHKKAKHTNINKQ